jgi:hypothetical protein
VNILSHYYIQKEAGDAYFTLGKVMPDFARSIATELKFKIKPEPKTGIAGLNAISQGIKIHYQTDKIFHNSQYFKDSTKYMTVLLQNAGLQNVRRFYFVYAHILLELMLDRFLIQDYYGEIERFYNQLKMIKKETILSFFEYNGLAAYFDRFWSFFREFNKTQYLYGLADNDRMVFALGRIVSKSGLPEFKGNDKRLLINMVDTIEPVLKSDYFSIFIHINNSIHS